MLCGLAGHKHCSSNVRGKHGLEILSVKINEVLEDTDAGIVHKNVQIAELLQNFTISPLDICLDRHVGIDWMHPQFSRRLRQPALVASRDGCAGPACDKRMGNGSPNAAPAPSDQCNCILQVHLLPSTALRTMDLAITKLAASLRLMQRRPLVGFAPGGRSDNSLSGTAFGNGAAIRLVFLILRIYSVPGSIRPQWALFPFAAMWQAWSSNSSPNARSPLSLLT